MMSSWSLGVLDVDADVPGTVRTGLHDLINGTQLDDLAVRPVAANDPNDPLRFSAGKKALILVTVASLAGMGAVLGPMVNTSYKQVVHDFNITLDAATGALSGWYQFAIGLGGLIFAPLSVMYGKRGIFVAAICLVAGTNLWLWKAGSVASLTAGRLVQGLALAPIELQSISVVADLFYVHQRGRTLACMTIIPFGMILVSQLGAGAVVEHNSWRLLFRAGTIAFFMLIPVAFFGFLETQYRRAVLLAKFGPWHRSSPTIETGTSTAPREHLKPDVNTTEKNEEATTARVFEDPPSKKTYIELLTLVSGVYSDDPAWLIFIRPLLILAYPAVIFNTFVHGLGVTWMHTFSFVKLAIFTRAPYNLTTTQVGMTVLPGAVLSFFGHIVSGFLSDALAKRLTRRNRGVFEPEFRLWLMLPQFLASTIGFFLFGWATGGQKPLWMALAGHALVAFSGPFGSLASFGYIVDTLEKVNQEAIVASFAVRAVFMLILADVVNGWIERSGSTRVFFILGSVNAIVSLSTIPFYIFGKRLRFALSRKATLNKLVGLK
ncbi:hypothetical protein PYCC9005_000305 [Savitreella phatthalungensis]